jgi:hypothetical protein
MHVLPVLKAAEDGLLRRGVEHARDTDRAVVDVLLGDGDFDVSEHVVYALDNLRHASNSNR